MEASEEKPVPLTKKLLVLIKATRPVAWPVLPVVFLAGFMVSGASFSLISLAQLFLLSFPFCVFYAFNDIYDHGSDMINPRKRGIGGVPLPPEYNSFVGKATILVSALLLLSGILSLNLANFIIMLLLLFLGYSYSAHPLRLKERPPLDSISNGLGFYLFPFLLGFSFGQPVPNASPSLLFPTLCFMSVHAFSTLMDYTADKKAGNTTFAIKFGTKPAVLFPLLAAITTVAFADFGAFVPMANEFSISCMRAYLSICAFIFAMNLLHTDEKTAKISLYLVYLGFLAVGACYITPLI